MKEKGVVGLEIFHVVEPFMNEELVGSLYVNGKMVREIFLV